MTVQPNVSSVASFLCQVCLLYNKGEALHGYCNMKEKCNKFHVCKSFVRGECRLQKCKRSHQLIHAAALKLLQDQGLSVPSVVNFQIISTYKHMKLHKVLESQGENIRGRTLPTHSFDQKVSLGGMAPHIVSFALSSGKPDQYFLMFSDGELWLFFFFFF